MLEPFKKRIKYEKLHYLDFRATYKGFVLSNIISVINFNLFLAFASTASTIEFGDDIKDFINADTISAVGALALIHPLDTLK